MDVSSVLRDILIVLVAAKLAAEVAERIGVPAVVGEIVAGILIGPSVLDLVGGGDEVLRTLGEIGVILLLLDVGLEMDLGELGKVGRDVAARRHRRRDRADGSSASAPWSSIGDDFKTSLFVGAALTATSVGITARVFGDLRALATTEARIVLGAAVADDVMGLVVLTVVVRLVTEGSVSVARRAPASCSSPSAFLVVGGVVGLRIAPPLFGARRARLALDRHARRARARVHARVRRARRRRQAGADRRRVRRRPRAGPQPTSPSASAASSRRSATSSSRCSSCRSASTPTSSAFATRERAARRRDPPGGRGRRQAASRRSAPSARRATSCSSGSACCPEARSA